MYRVKREQQMLQVFQGLQVIYEGGGEEYIVYRVAEGERPAVKKIRDMKDDEILLALATAIRIQPIASGE